MCCASTSFALMTYRAKRFVHVPNIPSSLCCCTTASYTTLRRLTSTAYHYALAPARANKKLLLGNCYPAPCNILIFFFFPCQAVLHLCLLYTSVLSSPRRIVIAGGASNVRRVLPPLCIAPPLLCSIAFSRECSIQLDTSLSKFVSSSVECMCTLRHKL